MTRLVYLDLGGNRGITGSVPTEWAEPNAFPKLQTLFLRHCSMAGPLPGMPPPLPAHKHARQYPGSLCTGAHEGSDKTLLPLTILKIYASEQLDVAHAAPFVAS